MNPRIAVPLYSAMAFSVLMALTGLAVAPGDVWPNVLLSGFFLAGIGLGGGFMVAVHDASNGRWLGPVRRIACSLTRLVLPGSIVVLAAILFSGSHLYPAFHEHLGGFRGVWLERTFFTVRAFFYVAAWMFALRILKKRPATFLVIFAFTVWLASVDWIMSLDGEWASTIFGVYHFAGLFTSALAAILIVAINRSRNDHRITSDHLHDLGKLLFAFSTFWMYIWFSQGMLIWYGNLRDETGYYSIRAYGNWGVLFWAVVALMWGLPFFVLLSEKTKRNRTIAMRIAVAVLIGHWLDLYVSIVPAHVPEPQLNGWELALALGTFATLGWAATRRETVLIDVGPALQPARSD
ncbi:MAG TPA: hypothetical protein VLV78_02400 [Thermoanaerobaculia bacterium]|nr:hypothetical protein [Thermoanaerobaculia bacterium]